MSELDPHIPSVLPKDGDPQVPHQREPHHSDSHIPPETFNDAQSEQPPAERRPVHPGVVRLFGPLARSAVTTALHKPPFEPEDEPDKGDPKAA
jgi:hypothetical protein